MATKIILTSDEVVFCPKCAEHFPLHQGIAKHTIQKYEQEFEAAIDSREQEIREEIRKEEERRARRTYLDRQNELAEQLRLTEEALGKAEAARNKAIEDAQARVRLEDVARK
jgi:hypothetical protein